MLNLQNRNTQDITREFLALLISLEKLPDNSSPEVIKKFKTNANERIDEFIDYLKNRKYK